MTEGGASDSAYTRLHIAPFDAELAQVVIPASVLPNARNISYHTVETLPDKRFGFVELPTADADKIRKKLNGNVLKGFKMRIDKARPESWKEPSPERPASEKKRKKNKDEGGKEKKRKKDHNVIPGVELEEGRKVKRGWTVTEEDKIKEKRKSKKERDAEKKDAKGMDKDMKKKKKKREERSKYTDKEECLMKTKLPGVPEPAVDPEDPDDRKKRKKSKSRETVIHEFANTTKFPTFLKANKPSANGPVTTEFVEGKGWVDAEGNLVEDVKLTRPEAIRRQKSAKNTAPPPPDEDTTSSSGTSSEDEEPRKKTKTRPPAKPAPAEDDTTSSSGSSSDEDGDSQQTVKEPPNTSLATPAKSILKSTAHPPADDSSSGESSDEDEDDEQQQSAKVATSSPTSVPKSDTRPKSSSSNVSLTIKIPPPPTTPGKVHPLEALYKRNKEAEGAEEQPFSFFAGGDDIEEDGNTDAAAAQLPMTPFTERDFEWRQLRSAAPTPDTAHPSRIKNFWAIGAEGEDEEMAEDGEADEADDTAEAEAASATADGGGEAGPSGDFQKWFWENRRDLNKSWMNRKKTAAKEKRHRDNKSRAAKAL